MALVPTYRSNRYPAMAGYVVGQGLGYLRTHNTPGTWAYGAKQVAKQAWRNYRSSGSGKSRAIQSRASNIAPPMRSKRITSRYKKNCPKGKLAKKICTLENKVKDLVLTDDASMGTMTYRDVSGYQTISEENLQNVDEIVGNDTGILEGMLAFLKYYNPATPGTLTTADATTGSYQRNCLIKSLTSNLVIRNNFQTDCKLRVYICRPKDDSNQSPLTAWGNALADGGNLTAVSDLLQYPSDYNLVSDLWSMKVLKQTTLSPGQSISVSHSVKDIEYDPAVVDSHNDAYQKEYKAFTYLIVHSGTICHDTLVLNEVVYNKSGLDIIQTNTGIIKYPAGVNINYVHAVNNLAATTNSATQSHQPMADNQVWSKG